VSNLVEYFLRIRNDTRGGLDAAGRDIANKTDWIARAVVQHAEAANKTLLGRLRTQWKDFSTSLKSDLRELASSVPGGRVISDMFGGSALGKVTAATTVGKGIQDGMIEAAEAYKNMAREMAMTQQEMITAAEQFAVKWKKAHELGTPEAFQEVVNTAIEKKGMIQRRIVDMEYERDSIADRRFLGMPDVLGINKGFEWWTDVEEMRQLQIASAQQDVFSYDQKGKKAARMADQIRSQQEFDAAEKAKKLVSDNRQEIIDSMSGGERGRLESMYNRGDKAGLKAEEEKAALRVQNLINGKPSEEANLELKKLAESAAIAAELLGKLAEEDKKAADEFWAKADKQHAGETALKERLKQERFSQLTPEQQLSSKIAEYRAVVADGRNQSDPEKKLAAGTKAADLRDAIRGLRDVVEQRAQAANAKTAKPATVADDDEDDGFGDDGTGRRLRMVGLGRLRGNRIPGQFGLGRQVGLRARASHFLGPEDRAAERPQEENPIVKEQRETNRLLNEVIKRTGFKR
jgi:hypothetical protein